MSDLIDLTKLNTIRLLALLKRTRSCHGCLSWNVDNCGHPSAEAIKEECARRGHIAKKEKRK